MAEAVMNIDQEINLNESEPEAQKILSDDVLENKFHLVRIKPCSVDRISSILQDAGYKAKIEGKDNRRYIMSGAEGWNFKITFYDDAPSGSESNHTSFQFSSGWSIQPDDHVKISEAANAFNRQYRYAKAFLGGEEGYVYTELEMSHYCFDGVSDEAFISFLDLFLGLRRWYVDLCKSMRSENLASEG
jgi:hypothetical protein